MNIHLILTRLHSMEFFPSTGYTYKELKGGTVSHLYLVEDDQGHAFVIKQNEPEILLSEVEFLSRYQQIELLPRLLYVDPEHQFIVYSYISGTTKQKVENKSDLLQAVVMNLINHYEQIDEENKYGWLDEPSDSWDHFLRQRTHDAKDFLGEHLQEEDFQLVSHAIVRCSHDQGEEPSFLLHGDCGIHNLIFLNDTLHGVIDPAPVVGDPRYDLVYAFCSSPDDLSKETIETAFGVYRLDHGTDERTIADLVLIGLYHRIASCIKHHPEDLPQYMAAWDYWRALVHD